MLDLYPSDTDLAKMRDLYPDLDLAWSQFRSTTLEKTQVQCEAYFTLHVPTNTSAWDHFTVKYVFPNGLKAKYQ
jgi:hypothetical protein